MPDWLKRNIAQLIDQVDKFITGLNTPGGLAASGLIAGQFTALTTLRNTVEANVDAENVALGAYEAALGTRKANEALLRTMLREMGRSANNKTTMTNEFREAAGLTVRDTQPSPGILPLVDTLVVIGHPNGNNALKWSAPAGARGVIYEIEVSMGSSGVYNVIGATSKTSFLHMAAGAGVHRLYRIVCRRGDLRGESGNDAAIYTV